MGKIGLVVVIGVTENDFLSVSVPMSDWRLNVLIAVADDHDDDEDVDNINIHVDR